MCLDEGEQMCLLLDMNFQEDLQELKKFLLSKHLNSKHY